MLDQFEVLQPAEFQMAQIKLQNQVILQICDSHVWLVHQHA